MSTKRRYIDATNINLDGIVSRPVIDRARDVFDAKPPAPTNDVPRPRTRPRIDPAEFAARTLQRWPKVMAKLAE